MLVSNQGFQFLDALCFSLKHKVMLLSRKPYQILRAVINFYPIKMMNNPAFRQWHAVSFFPNKDMFSYITLAISPMMCRIKYMHVSFCGLVFSAYTFRAFICPVFLKCLPQATSCPKVFGVTRLTAFCSTLIRFYATAISSSVDWLSTVLAKTIFKVVLKGNFIATSILTRLASFCCRATRLPAIQTSISVFFSPEFTIFFCPHTTIITYPHLNVNSLVGHPK